VFKDLLLSLKAFALTDLLEALALLLVPMMAARGGL